MARLAGMKHAASPGRPTSRTTANTVGSADDSEEKDPRPAREAPQAQAEDEANRQLHSALAEHEPQERSTLGAERHPHADLARAVARRERHHAVEADRRQDEGRGPERQEQRAEGAEEPGVERVLIAQRANPVERQRRIDLVDASPGCRVA